MTIISDLSLDENGLTELATTLQNRLATGGTVKERRIPYLPQDRATPTAGTGSLTCIKGGRRGNG